MVKTCFKCGEEKVLGEFYRHPGMKDGRLNKCKECAKLDVRVNRMAKREYYSQYERRRNRRPERRRAKTRNQRRARRRNPEKMAAWNAVSRAVKGGTLVPGPCADCGASRVQAHHEDYSRPLDVTWLCFPCHRARHGQEVVSDFRGATHRVQVVEW